MPESTLLDTPGIKRNPVPFEADFVPLLPFNRSRRRKFQRSRNVRNPSMTLIDEMLDWSVAPQRHSRLRPYKYP
jgi:hypothetical protein